MSESATDSSSDRFSPVDVDLKNPAWAALLAWLWPGAGHLYQRRYGKAALFMICILVTYFWGFSLGEGHVVYASFRPNDMRYQYLLQVGVGLPAMPAVIQACFADGNGRGPFGSFMAPPREPVREQEHDEKAEWNFQTDFYFELGTLFTMVAGLLNVLVIYDAYYGPAFTKPEGYVESEDPVETLARRRDGLVSLMRMSGIAIGLIGGLYWRATWDVPSMWVTYGFAIGCAIVGAMVGRGLGAVLSRFLYRELPLR